MRLRKKITRPQKLEDEVAYGKRSNDPTKPAFPHLLKSQVVSFNADLPAAAFPSLPIATIRDGQHDSEASAEQDTHDDESSADDFATGDDEVFTTNPHLKVRQIPCWNTPLGSDLEDEMATSDEDGDNVQSEDIVCQDAERADEEGHVYPQLSTISNVEWKDLRPAVQLAIISRMSEDSSMTKVYDKLGLYAQDLGDVRRLAAQYNSQSEMEDYLVFWMQQDQLSGVLRTDHTSTLRGAPEGYHEFQTESYMKKIRQQIDENLLQATCAEVDCGKRFLAQQGIERDLIGDWGYRSGGKHAARLARHQIEIPTLPVPPRTGLESRYGSATMGPNKCPMNQEAAPVIDPYSRTKARTTQRIGSRSPFRSENTSNLPNHSTPVPVKAQPHNLAIAHTNPPSPADDASPTGSSGRSRRSVRRTPRYDEAIAELKLRGSGVEVESDYNMSDVRDENSENDKPSIPSPRLRITSDNRIIGLPAPSQASQPSNAAPHIPRSNHASRAQSTALRRTASPLPLPRVIVWPPKPPPKPKQPTTVAQVSDGPKLNKFDQNLLGMPRAGSDFTKSLLKASERETANATPWIAPQANDVSENATPSMVDQRRHSSTIKAPAFSPITERFSGFPNQEQQGRTTAFYSSPVTLRSEAIDLPIEDVVTNSSLLATPELTSKPAASELHYSTGNGRLIVTETGSPVPTRQGQRINRLPFPANGVVSTDHTPSTTDLGKANAPPSPIELTSTPTNTSTPIPQYRKLDPVTGNIIIDTPPPLPPPPAHPPHAPSPTPTEPLTALQHAGEEIKKAALDLQSVATKMTKSGLPPPSSTTANTTTTTPNTRAPEPPPPPAKDVAITPPPPPPQKARDRNGVKALSSSSSTPSSSQDGQGHGQGQKQAQRRKYAKSEAQRRKEALRKERLERERRERREREGRVGLGLMVGTGGGLVGKGWEIEVKEGVEGLEGVKGVVGG